MIAAMLIAMSMMQEAAPAPPGTFVTASGPAFHRMTEEDQFHMRAVAAELKMIQLQINDYMAALGAQAKVREQDDLVKKVCDSAGIQVAECDVNYETGFVRKKEAGK